MIISGYTSVMADKTCLYMGYLTMFPVSKSAYGDLSFSNVYGLILAFDFSFARFLSGANRRSMVDLGTQKISEHISSRADLPCFSGSGTGSRSISFSLRLQG